MINNIFTLTFFVSQRFLRVAIFGRECRNLVTLFVEFSALPMNTLHVATKANVFAPTQPSLKLTIMTDSICALYIPLCLLYRPAPLFCTVFFIVSDVRQGEITAKFQNSGVGFEPQTNEQKDGKEGRDQEGGAGAAAAIGSMKVYAYFSHDTFVITRRSCNVYFQASENKEGKHHLTQCSLCLTQIASHDRRHRRSQGGVRHRRSTKGRTCIQLQV